MSKRMRWLNFGLMLAIIIFSVLVIASRLNIFGLSMYVVRSGSMEPAILTGSVVFVKAEAAYKVNDIITFYKVGSPETVTHRIKDVAQSEINETKYTVKGDANDSADSDPVAQSSVIGKTIFSLPLLGYLLISLRTLPGLLIFVLLPAVIIIYFETKGIIREWDKLKEEKKKRSDSKTKRNNVMGTLGRGNDIAGGK